uniref:SAM domain-containing protein n=1 Tax=Panagrolaimus superbus TaxID=310955 RepID=A0A914Z426_9BILA
MQYANYSLQDFYSSTTTTTTTTTIIDFRGKELKHWSIEDVIEWLQHLELNEYSNAFIKRNIRGSDLVNFDRTKYTQLGVTRIAHRQCMEQSLRTFISG